MRTLRGEPVDRPPVCFYDISGFEETTGTDPFNIFSHPSWKPVLELVKNRSDRIAMTGTHFKGNHLTSDEALLSRHTCKNNGSLYTVTEIKIGRKVLTTKTRRDKDINTIWTEESLLKDTGDLDAYLEIPGPVRDARPDIEKIIALEKQMGDSGIIMLDVASPLCLAAELFDMASFTIIAMQDTKRFKKLLERFAELVYANTRALAKALPGRLWRIVGPEYAAPPYLPPYLFKEYVTNYDTPIVDIIHGHGGFARLHSHGRLKDVLDDIAATGCMALDPVEPPPQGDVELSYVREKYGEQLVLFGNLEATDVENLPTEQFAQKIRQALEQGTSGPGRGFVLMTSSGPYGRELSPLVRANYEKMIELAGEFKY